MTLWFAYSMVALVLWGITGVTQKLATNRMSSGRAYLGFSAAMVALSAAVLVAGAAGGPVSSRQFALGAAGGLLNGLGVLTSYVALERGGKASVVASLAALYPLVTLAGALAIGEHLSVRQAIGAALALAAAILLSLEPLPEKVA